MIFSSIPFLYYFLPVVLTLYFLTPGRYKNVTLLLSSIFFYSWGEPKNMLIMLLSVLISFCFGLLIEKNRDGKKAEIFCIISVVITLSFLLYFKYFDFFIENINAVTGIGLPVLHIALPIGISFYTFQLISYTVDVYRGVPAQKSFVNLAAYITMFPQLIAGPIVRYSDIKENLEKRTHSFELAAQGIRRFILGLGKKILIANQLGELCTAFKVSDDRSVFFYWLYALAFSLHIYVDFSGYSDMAIGLGKIFGFHFNENFNYPYISKSITEFWRRWHISLGTWFRDYVYIPMGGNRKGRAKWFFNIFVVWLLTGFWHGAAWNFVIWGLYFAVLLVIEKTFLLKLLQKSRVFSRVYTLFFLMVSFVIFNADSLSGMVTEVGGLFGMGGIPLLSAEAVYYFKSFFVIILISIAGSVPFLKNMVIKMEKNACMQKVLNVIEPFVLLILLIVMTAFLVDGSFNPFLYFRF